MSWLRESCSSVSLQSVSFFGGDICKACGGVIEKTFTQFQWLSRCMSPIQSIQFIIACLSPIIHWADNFLFNLG